MTETAPRHRIGRLTYELEVPDEGTGRLFHDRLGAEHRRRLEQIVERCLDGVKHRGLIRIDRLEVDLGAIDSDGWEEALSAALERDLPRAVAARVPMPSGASSGADREAPPGSMAESEEADREVLEVFSRTGHTPWFVDPSLPQEVDAATERLLTAPGPGFAAWFRDVVGHPERLGRLVRHLEERTLVRLASQLAGGAERIVWVGTLDRLLSAGPPAARRLLARPPGAGAEARFRHGLWVAVLETLCRRRERRWSPAFWAATLARTARELGTTPTALLDALDSAGALSATLARDLVAAEAPEGGSSGPAADGFHPLESPSSSGDPGLSVPNAGLVLLWPFLPTLFTRLGLFQDGDFTDEAHRRRAVVLLHFLAHGDELAPVDGAVAPGDAHPEAVHPGPPEYQTPLAKRLCGVAPDAYMTFDRGPSPAEAKACDELLEAVVEQASALGTLSPAGFRGAFLRRPGVLTGSPAGGLLRVERKAYDLLLDRLPWSVGWVVLPWLGEPLPVDW